MMTDEAGTARKGKKRNPFYRRKQHDSGSEQGSDEGPAMTERQRNHHKLHWSPRNGHKNNALVEEASGESPTHHTCDDPESKHLALHWSPGLGRHRKKNDADEGLVIETGSSTNQIPHHDVGGSPDSGDNEEGGNKFAWPPRNGDQVSESMSDGNSEDGSTKKETIAQRLHRIRRKLNPRGKNANWRHHLSDHRIDEGEEEEGEFPMDDLDPLEGLCRHGPENSLAGDLEVPERMDLLTYRRDSSHAIDLTDHNDASILLSGPNSSSRRIRASSYDIQRTHAGSYDYDTSHRQIRAATYNGDAYSLLGTSHTRSGSAGPLSEGKPVRKSKSESKGVRVKPFHCFAPEVVYMTEAEIHHSMVKPSEKIAYLQSYIVPSTKQTKRMQICDETERMWGNTKDGRIGSLRVEVLRCVGLASVKPDVAVYLICGDVPFVTDCLNSCRSPMWPSNSKRAAVFPIHHAYARLYVGVFATKKDKNDVFCGRVVLDLAALRPNTEYDVTLPLRASSFIYDRRPRGVIRLRFSLHWFSECAAVLSYLKSPHSLVARPGDDNPSVLCGDPKTFRNVAVTVHGQDLPGKYTRKAFQATIREFNLSRLNLIFLVRTLATDAVMYEKPFVSLYLFLSWMHCIYLESVKLAPAYFVGYLIFHLFDNYELYNQSQSSHLGYAPPTLQELLYSLLAPSGRENIHPAQVSKKAVHSNQISRWSPSEKPHSGILSDLSEDAGGDIEPINYREFPFSEKLEYPMFRAEDAIAPSKYTGSTSISKTQALYLSEHLSMYASEVMDSLQSFPKSSHDEDDWEISDNDELDMNDSEDIRGDGDIVFMETEDEDEEEEDIHNLPHSGEASLVKRIPLGPPQDTDVKPLKTTPPQLILSRAENTLHKLTFGLSMDKLYHTTLAAGRHIDHPSVQESPEPDSSDGNRRRRTRMPFDDYDKRLGLCTRSKNPVVEITSSFLGPLMRMFRVFVVATRVVFNIGIWKDPFLSFWVLCFLLALMFILVIFPWRYFMFLVGLACFGPQNMLVRRGLLRQAAAQEKETEKKVEEEMLNRGPHEDSPIGDSEHSASIPWNTAPEETPLKDNRTQKGSLGPRRRFQNKIAQMKERRRLKKEDSSVSTEEPSPLPPRPAFTGAARHPKASKVPLEPREVVVPYTRIRTERFYYWPPDPTVSRATPVALLDSGFVEEVSLHSPNEGASPPSHLRRRFPADSTNSIPCRG